MKKGSSGFTFVFNSVRLISPSSGVDSMVIARSSNGLTSYEVFLAKSVKGSLNNGDSRLDFACETKTTCKLFFVLSQITPVNRNDTDLIRVIKFPYTHQKLMN